MTISAVLLLGCSNPAAHPSQDGSSVPMLGAPTASARLIENARIPSQGTCQVAALFATFPDEAPAVTSPPAWARDLFDPDLPGSFSHFYTEMSRRKLAIVGQVLPKY